TSLQERTHPEKPHAPTWGFLFVAASSTPVGAGHHSSTTPYRLAAARRARHHAPPSWYQRPRGPLYAGLKSPRSCWLRGSSRDGLPTSNVPRFEVGAGARITRQEALWARRCIGCVSGGRQVRRRIPAAS